MKHVVPSGTATALSRDVPKEAPACQVEVGKVEGSMLTASKTADLLELTVEQVDRLLDEGRIPFSLVGGHRMVGFDDMVEFKFARARERDAAAYEAFRNGVVTVEQAARILGMSAVRLAGRIEAGDVPVHQGADGNRVLRSEDVQTFSETLERENLAAVDEIIRMTEATGAYERQTPEFLKEYLESL
jgi:hypothetical protein